MVSVQVKKEEMSKALDNFCSVYNVSIDFYLLFMLGGIMLGLTHGRQTLHAVHTDPLFPTS